MHYCGKVTVDAQEKIWQGEGGARGGGAEENIPKLNCGNKQYRRRKGMKARSSVSQRGGTAQQHILQDELI